MNQSSTRRNTHFRFPFLSPFLFLSPLLFSIFWSGFPPGSKVGHVPILLASPRLWLLLQGPLCLLVVYKERKLFAFCFPSGTRENQWTPWNAVTAFKWGEGGRTTTFCAHYSLNGVPNVRLGRGNVEFATRRHFSTVKGKWSARNKN